MKIQTLAPKVYVPLLAAHAAVLVAEPARVLSWSYALVLLVLLFTLFLAGRRLRMSVAHNRPWWTMLLLALAMQLAAFGLLLTDSLVHPQGTLVQFDPTFYFCSSSLLLTLAAVYNPVGPLHRWASALDAVLACAVAGLFYALLRGVIRHDTAQASAASFVMWMFDAMALFVVACVTLRFATTKRADERRFFVVLLVFAWAELVFPAIHNRFILSSESYLPELCLDLPFVVLGLRLSQRRNVWFRWYRPSRRVHLVTGGISPFVLSMALCLLAFVQLDRNRAIAFGAMAVGIASYAMRVALLLGHHLRQEGELKHLQRGLRQTVIHDELTGLLNRRGFYRNFDRAWERSTRDRLPLTVALVDIDMFKTYNDTHGHLAGDDCLAKVGRALQQEADAYGDLTVARYGGEEFAVLLLGRDRMMAEHILQRLRLCVEALRIASRRSRHGVVTVSVGLAARDEGEPGEKPALLHQADQALYAAKHAGRNCLRWFAPSLHASELDRHG
ncbi:GGDEF domain-containing protein [Rhodanobacter geophilus]|uniref:diguanylate cyclase n=1 Tax=Rhodanobacter geophilus TaxID=3162488 RepID=A0ABV3QL85_9GAMM